MVIKTITNQEKIEALVADMHGQTIIYQQLCQLMFAVIDRFCDNQPCQSGPGRRKSYPDNDILKIDMLMHLTGKRGETEILREIERHYRDCGIGVCTDRRLQPRVKWRNKRLPDRSFCGPVGNNAAVVLNTFAKK